MNSIRPINRVSEVKWNSETRRLQVQYRNGQTRTFFNVTEADFEEVKSRRFLSLAVMKLLKGNQYPFNIDATR
jgi:hypothetical protein